jgi:hypothetical protein
VVGLRQAARLVSDTGLVGVVEPTVAVTVDADLVDRPSSWSYSTVSIRQSWLVSRKMTSRWPSLSSSMKVVSPSPSAAV